MTTSKALLHVQRLIRNRHSAYPARFHFQHDLSRPIQGIKSLVQSFSNMLTPQVLLPTPCDFATRSRVLQKQFQQEKAPLQRALLTLASTPIIWFASMPSRLLKNIFNPNLKFEDRPEIISKASAGMRLVAALQKKLAHNDLTDVEKVLSMITKINLYRRSLKRQYERNVLQLRVRSTIEARILLARYANSTVISPKRGAQSIDVAGLHNVSNFFRLFVAVQNLHAEPNFTFSDSLEHLKAPALVQDLTAMSDDALQLAPELDPQHQALPPPTLRPWFSKPLLPELGIQPSLTMPNRLALTPTHPRFEKLTKAYARHDKWLTHLEIRYRYLQLITYQLLLFPSVALKSLPGNRLKISAAKPNSLSNTEENTAPVNTPRPIPTPKAAFKWLLDGLFKPILSPINRKRLPIGGAAAQRPIPVPRDRIASDSARILRSVATPTELVSKWRATNPMAWSLVQDQFRLPIQNKQAARITAQSMAAFPKIFASEPVPSALRHAKKDPALQPTSPSQQVKPALDALTAESSKQKQMLTPRPRPNPPANVLAFTPSPLKMTP